MRDLVEKARAIPFTLAAGATADYDCDADSVFLSEGPTVSGSLYLRLDETGPDFTVKEGFFARAWRFRRLRLRNASGASVAGVLLLSRDPDFFVMAPGAGGGAGFSLEDLRTYNVRFFPFTATPNGAGSAGSSTFLRHPVLELDTGGTVATLNFRENREILNNRPVYSDATTTFWGRENRVRARVAVYTNTNGSDDDPQAGIELGYEGTGGAALAGVFSNLIRLRAVLNAGSQRFQLAVRDGATGNLETADLTGVATYADNVGFGLEIHYVPGQYVAGLVNGVEGARITATLPDATAVGNAAAGVFVGSDSTGLGLSRTSAAFINLEAITVTE